MILIYNTFKIKWNEHEIDTLLIEFTKNDYQKDRSYSNIKTKESSNVQFKVVILTGTSWNSWISRN